MSDAVSAQAIAKADDTIQIGWLLKLLCRARLPLQDEKALQAAIEERLLSYGVAYQREHVLERNLGIIDFFLPTIGVGIEVKIAGSSASVLRQLRRYAEDSRIRSLVLVRSRSFATPVVVGARRIPLEVIDLGRGWL